MERSCDVVMKGGITSGVVYPLAIIELAEEYRLRSLGGTSAGAIAAAGAAAAQYGKNQEQGTGFAGLESVPDELGKKLETLFQASPSTAPFFDIVLAASKAGKSKGAKAWAIFQSTLSSFFYLAMVGALPGLAFGYLVWTQMGTLAAIAGTAVAAILAVVGAIGAVLAYALRRMGKALPENYYGLCTGYRSEERSEPKPLTTWLADKLDELAGKDGAEPLTFGDLWGSADLKQEREVNLEMITTCLTHGCAYRLPIASNQFWFSPNEFGELFPKRIVDWMVDHARPSESDEQFEDRLHLPAPADFPVVVAARMSLSFPILISAIPLYAIDHGRKDVPKEQLAPEQCWFSDGGIISNFPIHFFDSPLPRWPTFGINLRGFGRDWPEHPGNEAGNVAMPERNSDGLLEHWTSWKDKKGLGQIAAFLGSIVTTSRSWSDNAQARAPGYRDRIVHIAHNKDEGGMNLAMPEDVIKKLTARGARAGGELRRHYAADPDPGIELTWKNQRWVRYRSFIAALERALSRLEKGKVDFEGQSILELINRGKDERPPAYPWGRRDDDSESTEFADAQRRLAQALSEALFELADDSHTNELSQGSPQPRPELGLTPRA